jgi:signal transduction histidine kinase
MRDVWVAAAILIAYAAATLTSRELVLPASGVTLVWLPAGVAFGLLWIRGRRCWPLLAVSDLLAQAWIGNPLGFLPFAAFTNTFGALVAVSLARRLSAAGPGTYSVRTAAVLSASGLTLGLASAPLGVVGLIANQMLPAAAAGWALLAWVTANGFGLLLVAPAMILALTAIDHRAELGHAQAGRIEALAWALAAALGGLLALWFGRQVGASYPLALAAWPLALLLWASVRFAPLFTALASLLSGLGLVLLLVSGLPPLQPPQSALQATAVLLFLSVVAVMPLVLAAYAAERRRALQALAAANAELESRVTERTEALQHALDDLRAAQDSLVRQETLAGLGGLVAGVAHELNSPLDVVLTAASRGRAVAGELRAELARPRPHRSLLDAGAAELEQGLELVLGSARRAAQLIGAFKQVAADQHQQQRRRCELAQLLGDALLALAPAHRERLDIQLDTEPCALYSYPGALFTVLQQLIANAAQHAYPEGRGPLSIRLRATPTGGAVIEVEDRGVGMSAELAARAFHPFVTTRRGRGSTGLGLHVVHNAVSGALGGEIDLQSAPGQGTRIRITLPAEAPAGHALGH